MRKRSFRLALGLAIGWQVCFAEQLFGQGVDVFVSPAAQTVNVGDAVGVQVRLNTNGLDVCQGGVFLQFDTAGLQFVSGANNTATWNSGLFNVEPAQNEPGIISLNVGGASAVNGNDLLVSTLNFTALNPGSAALTLLFNAGAEETQFFASNCSTTVTTSRTGGAVNIQAPTTTPANTPTPTPTNTPTATGTAVLLGAVSLQGRPAPPDPRWSVPLQVSLTPQGGGAALTCTPTTDQSGNFTCSGFPPGTYTGCVKHSHTLQNCQSVTLAGGSNNVNFGTLREGDANNDNCVLLVDFSILVSTFSKCSGDAGFDARADFDLSGCVVLVDFSLLATNFSQCGATPPQPPPPAERALAVGARRGGRAALTVAAPATVRVGQRFSVALQVEAGQQPVDGAAAYVNFDPQMLQVEEVTAGGQLGVELHREVDNEAGSVDYAAATFENFPAGTFDVATLHFRALRTGATTLVLNRTAPRQSDVTFGGASVLAQPQIATVTITNRSLPHGAGHRTRPTASRAMR